LFSCATVARRCGKPDPRGPDPEEHPFTAELLTALREAGIEVRSAVL
jgi:hypothetical protein